MSENKEGGMAFRRASRGARACSPDAKGNSGLAAAPRLNTACAAPPTHNTRLAPRPSPCTFHHPQGAAPRTKGPHPQRVPPPYFFMARGGCNEGAPQPLKKKKVNSWPITFAQEDLTCLARQSIQVFALASLPSAQGLRWMRSLTSRAGVLHVGGVVQW